MIKGKLSGAEYAALKYNEFHVREACTLTEFLSKQMSGISRNRLKNILQGRGVTVDKQIVTQYDYQLRPGMTVRVSKRQRKTMFQSKWMQLVYEDKDIIVINKEPGILSMGATARQFCVKTVLDKYFESRHFKCHAHVVHRIDKETSGLLVYAKSIEAAQILQADWKGRCFDRRYVALVEGRVEKEGGTIESWLRERSDGTMESSPIDNGGKRAVTHYHTLKTTADLSLVEMRLETGRKNQIRVHMADIGHPILGDSKYGTERNPLNRLCLHAFRLFLYHPITNERLEFETPYPISFVRLIERESNDK